MAPVMPQEVRDTVRMYLAGKLDQAADCKTPGRGNIACRRRRLYKGRRRGGANQQE